MKDFNQILKERYGWTDAEFEQKQELLKHINYLSEKQIIEKEIYIVYN